MKHIKWETSKVIFWVNEFLGVVVLCLIMFGWLKSDNRMDSSQMFTADISFMGLNAVVYGAKSGFENNHKYPKGVNGCDNDNTLQKLATDMNTITNLANGLQNGDVGSVINTVNDTVQQIKQAQENDQEQGQNENQDISIQSPSINHHMGD